MFKYTNLYQWGWRLIVATTTLVAAVDIPVRLVLDYQSLGRVTGFDWFITLIFAADMLLNPALATRRGRPARDVLEAQANPGPWFAIDLAAAVPFTAFLALPPLQLLRLLKLARVAEMMRRWQRAELHNPNVIRLVVFLFWLALGLHWLACGWLSLRGVSPDVTEGTNYLLALYWCVTTLATVGYGDITPTTNVEVMYALLTISLGVGVFGYVIGSVASLLANIDPARVRHQEMVERVKAFMRYRQVPSALRQRILDYYEYLWEKRLGYDESLAVSGLPPSLRTEVCLFLNREIIQKVPLFRAASEEFVRAIALEMRPVIYMPGDYIIRAGDIGEEMYFISQGTVEVLSADERKVYAVLKSGEFFGEMALLFNQLREASVRALDYCDLYLLTRASLERTLVRHPEIAARITAIAQQRREENVQRQEKRH
ncbi:MAG: cyclic nucleotide-binding domain-containing protein [Acidobacteria bacterium]|nr:cyclic nucleotide-binding domain-containing protein [Acidobacteriota bacterium]